MVTSNQTVPNGDALVGGERSRILITEDEPGNREMLADVFHERGFAVEMAATGQEALAKGQEQPFDGVILDVRLPDMIGTDLLDQLRKLQPDIAAVMVTGYASLQTSIRAIQSGADAYLLKPLDISHLVHVMDQALERRRSGVEGRRLLAEARERILALEQREAMLIDRVERLEEENAALRRAQ